MDNSFAGLLIGDELGSISSGSGRSILAIGSEGEQASGGASLLPRFRGIHVPHLDPAVARPPRTAVDHGGGDSGSGHLDPSTGGQDPLHTIEDPSQPPH